MNTKNFGTVEFEGKTITLTSEALGTGRVMLEYANPQEWVEYEAKGITAASKSVIVRWHFKLDPAITEEDQYDWNNVESVTPLP